MALRLTQALERRRESFSFRLEPIDPHGWLRASHRKLDDKLTLPFRPYHTHDEVQPLTPGEVYELDIEIWPTSMVFKKGNRIRLDVQPRDGFGSQSYLHYHADYNVGSNTIYAGGEYESYLLLPVIPPKRGSR